MNFYQEIIQLRNIIDDADRGYKFEQIIREILPWDRKPPVVASLPSEQLDGIFLWKEQAYLIESKAKKNKITPGSHDWEDFELKIRRRKNAVIGIFCSLFSISDEIYIRANELNKEGHFVIVLAGDFWDEINSYQLPMKDLLEYMNLYGRVKFLSKPDKVKKILDWCYDKDTTSRKISDLCKKNSAIFLRRHRSPFHKGLYIYRDIDNQIEYYSKNLKPSVVLKSKLELKEIPKQYCLVRDYSGSGKTTLSIEIAENSESYFGTGIAANEPNIDIKISEFFYSLGDNFGLLELMSVNKPIVFVIDSLDEANFDLTQKRKEILSIINFIEFDLAELADRFNLAVFPVLFIFTIREDYWRDWESLFEGRKKNEIKKRISSFTNTELPKALKNYSDCYGYTIINRISEETKDVLSTPINLLIFSETYQYQGEIAINEIWEGSVIDTYFNRKKEDIHKRHIQGFTANVFFQIISLLAFHVVATKKNSLSKNDVASIIKNHFFMILHPYLDEVINALVSEHILVIDSETLNHYRFRHSRFIEFLLAYYIVYTVEKEQNTDKLNDFTQISFDSGVVLMFRVHEDIRYIGRTKFPKVLSQIEDYYSVSNLFMSKKLLKLRSQLSANDKTNEEDIKLILKNVSSNNDEVISNAFFVIAAKSNNQTQQIVLDLFLAAYKNSKKERENYKLIAKLEHHNLLLNEKVIQSLLHCFISKDWEVYLGLIHANNLQKEFLEIWLQLNGMEQLKKIIDEEPNEDWTQVLKLMDSIYRNEPFILGT